MTTEQNVGFGALLGGGSAVLTNVLIRYFADKTLSTPKEAGEQPSRPFVYEHAPLFGIIPAGVATFVAYKWMGGAPAAVAAAICGLFASTAPPIDAWAVDARNEKDSKETQEPAAGEGEGRYAGFARRMAALGRAA